MKFASEEQQRAHRSATTNGGLRGLAYATAFSLPTYYLLTTRSSFYRQLPAAAKAFGFVVVGLPLITVSGEKAGEAYDRSQWTGVGKMEIDAVEAKEQARWERLGTGEKLGDWAKRRKYGIIGTAWATCMVGSFALVSRNKYQSFSQKLVQARVYAQGLTIGLLVVSAIVAGTATDDDETVKLREDHSWREILEQEGLMKEDGGRAVQMKDAAHLAKPKRGE